ncbi:MAG: hypothetical protein WAL77_06525 [Candidatus Dormiibacterota bacterium]
MISLQWLPAHTCEEIGLVLAAGDLRATERAVESHVDVKLAAVFVEVKKRPGAPREGTTLALSQLGKLAELHQ